MFITKEVLAVIKEQLSILPDLLDKDIIITLTKPKGYGFEAEKAEFKLTDKVEIIEGSTVPK